MLIGLINASTPDFEPAVASLIVRVIFACLSPSMVGFTILPVCVLNLILPVRPDISILAAFPVGFVPATKRSFPSELRSLTGSIVYSPSFGFGGVPPSVTCLIANCTI